MTDVQVPAPVASPGALWARARNAEYRNEVAAMAGLLLATFLLSRRLTAGVLALGLSNAAVLVLHAVPIILVFRAGRFVNFAQLQVATTAGGLFLALVQGQLFLNILRSACGCVSRDPGPLARNINFVLAAVLVVALAGLVCWLASITILNRFRRSPRVMLTLVTVFAGQALAGSTDAIIDMVVPDRDNVAAWQLVVERPTNPPGDFAWKLDSLVTIRQSHVVLLVLALATLVGVSAYVRKSRTGAAIQAAAENPARAQTLGIDVQQVSARVWLISGLLAGVAGVVTSFGGVVPTGTQLAQIPAEQLSVILAVAVLARFHSMSLAGMAALTLGLVQVAVQTAYGSTVPLDAVFVFLIGGLLLLQRDRQSHRERDEAASSAVAREVRPVPQELRNLPQVRTWRRTGAIGVALVALGMPWAMSASATRTLTLYVVYAVIGLSLLVLTGWSGLVSLGQFGFAAVGAWASVLAPLPFPFDVVAGGVAGATASVVVGLPALRLRGLTLAMSTLAFAVTARALFVEERYLGGLLPRSVDRPSLLGMDLDDTRVFYYVCLVALAACCVGVAGLRRSRFGRVLIGMRANEAAAQSFGVSVLRARLTSFAVAGFLAASAGGLLALLLRGVPPSAFGAEMSITMFMFTVIGGLGGIIGPLLGFAFMASLNLFGQSPFLVYTASGMGGLLLLIAAPGGLAQLLYDVRDAALRRLAVRLRIRVPSLLGERGAGEAFDRAILDEDRAKRPAAGRLRYKLQRQWALDRYGRDVDTGERVGRTRVVARG